MHEPAAILLACIRLDAAGKVFWDRPSVTATIARVRLAAREDVNSQKGLVQEMARSPAALELKAGRSGAFQQCINPSCAATFGVDETHFSCPACGDLLDVVYEWDKLPVPRQLADFEAKWASRADPLAFSGVWRFRELLPFAPKDQIVTIGEGQTLLQRADKVGRYVGLNPGSLWLQYEGMNPSGSFKDNGMTAAFTHARMVSARRVACASTGNTSAALAVYCSATDLGFRAIIFIGSGKIAYGKLAQALDHRGADDPDRRRL